MAQQVRESAVQFVLPTWWPKTVSPISRDPMSSMVAEGTKHA